MRKVFLSSTSRDLSTYRDAAYQAIERLDDFHGVRMEDFGARDAQADDFCRARIAECDVAIILAGLCYGSSPEGSQDSYTVREYEAAKDAKLPRLIFLSAEDSFYSGYYRESDERWDKQQAFRALLNRERIRDEFKNPEELAAKVTAALSNWVRAHPERPSAPDDAARDEMAESKRDMALRLIDLRGQLRDLEEYFINAYSCQPKPPLIAFAYSSEQRYDNYPIYDAYFVLVERFVKLMIPQVCKTASWASAQLEWPQPEDTVERRLRELKQQLWDHLEMRMSMPQHCHDTVPTAICRAINDQKYLRTFSMVLRNPDLKGDDGWLIDRWLKFWEQISRHGLRYTAIVFMCLTYPKKGLFGGALSYPRGKKRAIEGFLQSRQIPITRPPSERHVLITVLRELLPLNLEDIEKWIDRNLFGLPASKLMPFRRKVTGLFAAGEIITIGQFFEKVSKIDVDQI